MHQQQNTTLTPTMTQQKTNHSTQTETQRTMTHPKPTQSKTKSDSGPRNNNTTLTTSSPGLATDAAQLRGHHLETILQQPHLLPPLSKGGLQPTTIRGHRKALHWLTEVPLDLRHAPLPVAILGMVNRQRQQRHWKWSTTTTKMATIQGALALLPVYATIQGHTQPILLRHAPAWTLALKAAARKAREQQGRQPKAATDNHVKRVLRNTNIDKKTRAIILLSWLTAARVGDALKLRACDITIINHHLTVTWHEGKTVAKRGPYTVTTTIPSEFLSLLTETLAPRQGNQAAFPTVTGKAVKIALRTADPNLEQRSLRRGALQLLAASGLPLETVMLFSGHTTAQMLLRYLGYGRMAKANINAMIQAANMTFHTA